MNPSETLFTILDALPNDLAQSIYAVHSAIQSPLPLITNSVLCSLSSAVQGHVDVDTIYGATQPVSIFSLVIADSGERKSSTDRLVSKPLRQLEQEAQAAAKSINAAKMVEKIKWNAEVKKRTKQLQASDPLEQQEAEATLTDLLERKPGDANTTHTILNDVTPAALFRSLAGDGNAITLASSDAGNLFTRTNMDFISNVNQIWDGEDITIARQSGDQAIKNGRLTLSLMLQPDVLKRISDRKADLLRLSGYFARMLVTRPRSTQGYRLSATTSHDSHYLNQFHNRLTRLAKESIHYQANKKRVTLTFNPEALLVMRELHDQVEAQLKDTAILASIRDAGSKIVNNATRIAALIHTYKHGVENTEIDASTTNAARCLASFYLREFFIIFAEKSIQQRAEENADLLYEWFKKNNVAYRGCCMKLSRIMQFGPNRVRKRAELDLALEVLIQKQILSPYLWAKPACVVWNEPPYQTPQSQTSPATLEYLAKYPL